MKFVYGDKVTIKKGFYKNQNKEEKLK